MSRNPFRLKSAIGRSYPVDPDDTHSTKKALRELGYYEIPSYGLTPYPDERMFSGVELFQDDFDLHFDGVINPGGETATKLNEVLDQKNRISKTSAQRTGIPNSSPTKDSRSGELPDRSTKPHQETQGDEQIAVAPALPVIVYEIAALFGMTLAAAYAWWIALSGQERKRVRDQVRNAQDGDAGENANESICEQLFKIDMDTCRQIAKRRGKRAAARCYASANERYAACRRGKPRDQWPPLDTWNN